MEVIRRNTDYAFRLMAAIASEPEQLKSVRKLAAECFVPYQLACKLLQKLCGASLVDSKLGPKGGYKLAVPAEQINLRQIIEAIQGPIIFNECLNGRFNCPLSRKCPIRGYLAQKQSEMVNEFGSKTLAELVKN